MPKRSLTFDDARKMALALPGTEERTSYGVPAFYVRGKMFACQPSHKSAEPGSLVVRIDFNRRDELLDADPATYYIKEHYEGYTSVLVRLKYVHPDALRDLLTMAHAFMSSSSRRTRRRSRV
jgi:hypothetical protein